MVIVRVTAGRWDHWISTITLKVYFIHKIKLLGEINLVQYTLKHCCSKFMYYQRKFMKSDIVLYLKTIMNKG